MNNVYLFFRDCCKVDTDTVIINDIASVYCNNPDLQGKIRALKIYDFSPEQPETTRIIITALKAFETILSQYPDVNLIPTGSTDIIIEKNLHAPPKAFVFFKAFIICLITFFGAAFTIMAFNNDVQVHNVFAQIYTLLSGQESDGFTPLEFSYGIGLGAGILIFYNHFGKKSLSNEPTPMEIEMRQYENDVHTTLVEGVKRKNEHIDV